MKICAISLTGADDTTDVADLLDLSDAFPLVEWGILFSSTRAGKARYPSNTFMDALYNAQTAGRKRPLKLAAHLCGATMRGFMKGITFEHYDAGNWLQPHGLSERMFNEMFARAQINFNAPREGFQSEDLAAMMRGWYETMDGCVITQHNTPNADVWQWCQRFEHQHPSAIKAHQILHDASGGNGIHAATWNKPVAGIINGYAGGLGPDNIIDTLIANEDVVGDGVIWIDMEGALRDADDAFDLQKAETVLTRVYQEGTNRNWFL